MSADNPGYQKDKVIPKINQKCTSIGEVNTICFLNSTENVLKIRKNELRKENIMKEYFGKIEKGWVGFTCELNVKVPYFEKEIEIILGEEYNEDGEENDTVPTDEQLTEYESTLKSFLLDIDRIIIDIQKKAFEYYHRVYAEYYEKPFVVLFENAMMKEGTELHPPLKIESYGEHFKYMQDLLGFIRILDNRTIILPIHYDLDHEHGMEIRIVDGIVTKIGGIDET